MTLEWAPSPIFPLRRGFRYDRKEHDNALLSSSFKKQAGTNCFLRHIQSKKPNLFAPVVESSSVLASRDLIMRSSWGLSYVKPGQRDAGTKCIVNLSMQPSTSQALEQRHVLHTTGTANNAKSSQLRALVGGTKLTRTASPAKLGPQSPASLRSGTHLQL